MTCVALITGAASGIGLACAKAFVDAGWRTHGIDRLSMPADAPALAGFLRLDLAELDAVAADVPSFMADEEAVHVLVNNAASQVIAPLLETDAQTLEAVFRLNLGAPLLLTRLLFDKLRRAGGAVVNVASVHATATSAHIGAYAASKAALVSLTRTMALEFGPLGVRANALLPGAVDTAMLRQGLERDHVEPGPIEGKPAQLAAKHPLGRIGAPEDMARAVLFLADASLSGFMTGQTLVVDGGALARLSTE